MKRCLYGMALMAAVFAAQADDVAKFDPRIAADVDEASSDGFVWYDAASLKLESQGFPNCTCPYGRIPADLADQMTEGIQRMGRQATGHYLVFQTDAPTVGVRWDLESRAYDDPFIPPQGMYGVDIYQRIDGTWRFCHNGRLRHLNAGEEPSGWEKTATALTGTGMKPVMVYLPTRAVVRGVRIGLAKGSKLEAWAHPSGIVKPVVHYGTSIVHGGCASRPGICFTSIAGRTADVPYVNLGFSGQAHLHPVMAEAMGRIDASLFLVDPAWNCDGKLVRERLEPFLRRLHALRPEVKILVCEGSEPRLGRHGTNDAIKEVYDRLVAEGSPLSEKLCYLPAEGMLPRDGESTHDYCHPNDYGSIQMGKYFAAAIRRVLGL